MTVFPLDSTLVYIKVYYKNKISGILFSDYYKAWTPTTACSIEPSALLLRLFNNEFSYAADMWSITLSLERPNSSNIALKLLIEFTLTLKSCATERVATKL